jgi:hypothetical protein
MSAWSEFSSHRTTVWRKLSIITPTPTVTDTAITRAAMATAVREREATTPPVAIRPRMPRRAPMGRRRTPISRTVAPGARRAQPRITAKRPAKLSPRWPPGTASKRPPRSSRPTPMAVARGRARRSRVSRDERVSAARGDAWVASMAGTSAARRVAPIPMAVASRSVEAGMESSRTETTK